MRYLVLGVDRDDCGFDPPSLGMFYVEAPNRQTACDAAEKRDKYFLCVDCLDAARLRELADEVEGLRPHITVRDSRRDEQQLPRIGPGPGKQTPDRQQSRGRR